MEGFETNTVINEASLKEIKHQLMPRQRTILLVSSSVAFCLLLLGIATRVMFTAWVAAAAVAIFILEYFLIANRNVKVILKRIRESAHGDEYRYTTSFSDSGMLVVNHTMDSKATIYYQDMKYMQESKNYYILSTKAGQFALLDRIAIDNAGKREALKTFLHSRCPRIRWKGKG